MIELRAQGGLAYAFVERQLALMKRLAVGDRLDRVLDHDLPVRRVREPKNVKIWREVGPGRLSRTRRGRGAQRLPPTRRILVALTERGEADGH